MGPGGLGPSVTLDPLSHVPFVYRSSRKISRIFQEIVDRLFVERLLVILSLAEMNDTNGTWKDLLMRKARAAAKSRKLQNHVCTSPGLFKLRRVVTKYDEEEDRVIRLESCCHEPDSARTSFKVRCVPAVTRAEAREYLYKHIDSFVLEE